MNKALNNAAQIITMTALVILAMLSVACDKNMAKPEDLVNPAISISIGEFSASSSNIIKGESTTLSWSVSDPDGKVQSVSIDPGVGNVPMSGSKVVRPTKSTIYHLNISSNNEVAKSRTVGITVTDDQGNEITEDVVAPVIPTSETACNDVTDEDQDGAVDCDDSDCAEAANCIEPVYRFADCVEVPHTSKDSALVGDEIAITWKECPFDSVIVNGLPGVIFMPTDTYVFNANEAQQITKTLIGQVGSAVKDNITLSINVDEVVEPTFDADVSFSIQPATVFAGQNYKVIWNVNNAATVQMGSSTLIQGEEEFLATDNATHTLTVTDNNGIMETFTKSVKVKKFVAGSRIFNAPVTKMIKGKANGEYHFITSGNVIYKTTDGLKTVTTLDPTTPSVPAVPAVAATATTPATPYVPAIGVTGQIASILVDGANTYVGSSNGLYQSSASGFKQVVFTAGVQTIQALHKVGGGKILSGSSLAAHLWTPSTPYFSGTQVPGIPSHTSVQQFMCDPANKNYIVALTDKGLYESADRGLSFSPLLSNPDLKGGFWKSGSGFVWSDGQIFEWNGSSFAESNLFLGVTDINFVLKAGGRVFVATSTGVLISDGSSYFVSNLGDDVRFLVPQGGIMNRVVAVTDQGVAYSIDAGLGLKTKLPTSGGGQ